MTLLLFMYDPFLTLLLISFLIFVVIFLNFLSKKKLIEIGSKRQKFDTQRYKLLQKSFGPPIKLIKILFNSLKLKKEVKKLLERLKTI